MRMKYRAKRSSRSVKRMKASIFNWGKKHTKHGRVKGFSGAGY